MWLLVAIAFGQSRPSTSLTWALSVDGQPVGQRTIDVTWPDVEHRVLHGSMVVDARDLERRGRGVAFTHQLAANSQQGRPAAFTSSIRAGRVDKEIQARRTGTTWSVVVTEGGSSRTHTLPHDRVDLSTVDLLDPESERSLIGRTSARVLIAETGKIEEGPVTRVGTQRVLVAGEEVEVEAIVWTTSQGPYRLWYAPNGWLVRWEAPMFGLTVQGVLEGEAPRGTDEFPVGDPRGSIEELDL